MTGRVGQCAAKSPESDSISTLASRDYRERSHASTRGGVQVSVAALRTLHARLGPIFRLENSGSERRSGTTCLSATEQVLFNRRVPRRFRAAARFWYKYLKTR